MNVFVEECATVVLNSQSSFNDDHFQRMRKEFSELSSVLARPQPPQSASSRSSQITSIPAVDLFSVFSSACRESVLSEKASGQYSEYTENAELNLDSTVSQRRMVSNPFSHFQENKIRYFPCCGWDGILLDCGGVMTPLYRSPWSNQYQTPIREQYILREISEEKSDLILKCESEATDLFSNKDLTLHRQILESFTSPDRASHVREIEVAANSYLQQYLDAYFSPAVELLEDCQFSGATAGALLRDSSGEKGGFGKHAVLDAVVATKNNVATESGSAAWTSLHMARFVQLDMIVKGSFTSRVAVEQKMANSTIQTQTTEEYDPFASVNFSTGIQMSQAILSANYEGSEIVGTTSDAVINRPDAIVRLLGDGIQDIDRQHFVGALLGVQSASVAQIVSSVVGSRRFSSKTNNFQFQRGWVDDDERRAILVPKPTNAVVAVHHKSALEIASRFTTSKR